MNYPDVKSAHIVPAAYLALFAIDRRIGVHQVDEGKKLVRRVEEVGTRSRYYRRERPDGTSIDDVEWSLSQGESVVAPVLRALDAQWPLNLEDKAKLAEHFAYQLIRTPRWREEHEEFTRDYLADVRREGSFEASDQTVAVTDEDVENAREHLLSSTARGLTMLRIGSTLASVLGSMHWTLVEFRTPVLATSDHPVVLWPLGVRSRLAEATPLRVGVLETLEVRIPVSPTRALLLTWSDKLDDEDVRVGGSRHHAGNLNAFTVASADRQWFFLPGTSVPIATGRLLPLSPELVVGYSDTRAVSSQRRGRTRGEVQPKIGRELTDREISIVTMTASTTAQS